jgi:HSP20 family molecular chaperone IbpA
VEIVYELPEMSEENITVQVSGLSESETFDSEDLNITFSNFSESKNLTAEIELTNSEGMTSSYEITFILEVYQ